MKTPKGIIILGLGLAILQIPFLILSIKSLATSNYSLGVFVLCLTAIGFSLSWGLCNLKNWARLLFLILTTIFVLLDMVNFIQNKQYLDKLWLISSVTIYCLIAVVYVYLLNPKVVQHFKR